MSLGRTPWPGALGVVTRNGLGGSQRIRTPPLPRRLKRNIWFRFRRQKDDERSPLAPTRWPRGFAVSTTATGNIQAALWVIVGLYLVMGLTTWAVYQRRSGAYGATVI